MTNKSNVFFLYFEYLFVRIFGNKQGSKLMNGMKKKESGSELALHKKGISVRDDEKKN